MDEGAPFVLDNFDMPYFAGRVDEPQQIRKYNACGYVERYSRRKLLEWVIRSHESCFESGDTDMVALQSYVMMHLIVNFPPMILVGVSTALINSFIVVEGLVSLEITLALAMK
jgi:hypothetical protein